MYEESIIIKRQEKKNLYKVSYSEFHGVAFVYLEKGSIIDIQFKSSDKSPISAQTLREFPLNAVEILINNQENSKPATKRPSLERPEKLDEKFLTQLSKYYLDALCRNERPLVSIEQETGAPRNTVARWVAMARREEYLK